MKKYIEPELQIAKYTMTDVLAASDPEVKVPDIEPGGDLDEDW